jgi:hypothetical protein
LHNKLYCIKNKKRRITKYESTIWHRAIDHCKQC